MTQILEPIEVVILSGPRRGEIVRLPREMLPEVSDEDVTLLNQALDDLIAAVDRLGLEVRVTSQALKA